MRAQGNLLPEREPIITGEENEHPTPRLGFDPAAHAGRRTQSNAKKRFSFLGEAAVLGQGSIEFRDFSARHREKRALSRIRHARHSNGPKKEARAEAEREESRASERCGPRVQENDRRRAGENRTRRHCPPCRGRHGAHETASKEQEEDEESRCDMPADHSGEGRSGRPGLTTSACREPREPLSLPWRNR